ncbi:hypothetical protein A3860_10475 [Niastella vici]|uniref:Phosphoribosylpyrophosphate synthetase n=1 Tax=Niastella vici TaxID=1703345 RepID=A0A1V9FF51_9BACT|nr:hypothetical protein [Niastella vici]OQP56988.1 hypothetical protein A3860_10475 [Niastella vici]
METKPSEMTTLTEVLEKLRHQHNDNEFKPKNDGFITPAGKFYKPEDLTIIKTYRFEGVSDPADSSIVYIIEAHDGTLGYTMDAYGVYTTHDEVDNYDDLIKRLPVQEREEQEIFH